MAPPHLLRKPTVPRRRLILLPVAFLVPCAVVATLAYRMMALDRELAVRRLEDDRQHVVTTVGQELLARLERLKAVAASDGGPSSRQDAGEREIALVGWVEGNRLVLPWDRDPAAVEARAALGLERFAARVARGEHDEIARGEPLQAIAEYRAAAAAATRPAQSAYAELLLARAHAKAGRTSEADALDRRVLARPLTVVDEFGVPFALYAARRITERQSSAAADVRSALHVAEAAAGRGWVGPTAWYMALAVATAARSRQPGLAETADALISQSTARTRRFEQAAELQRLFAGVLAQIGPPGDAAGSSAWIPFGADPWLVSVARRTDRAVLVAAGAQAVFDRLTAVQRCRTSKSCEMRLVFGRSGAGTPLGAGLPEARLDYRVSGASRDALRLAVQRRFYLSVLLVVTALSLLGALLLWRDVRRELRIAEMRSQFVASVSHELKTPLTAIRMFAETLRMGRPADPGGRNEYLDTIVNESERLTRLLNNVLDFSRIEQGHKQYDLAPHDLAAVVRAAARAMQYPLAQQGFDLDMEIEPSLPRARVDADAVEQAILNLLANAMKYSGDGRQIDLALRRDGAFAAISVRDRGVGIAPHEQRRIFEKFYRVASAENERIPGTGLGLTLVEHIARAHGGSVEVHSAPGLGSTFVLRLPLGDLALCPDDDGRASGRPAELEV